MSSSDVIPQKMEMQMGDRTKLRSFMFLRLALGGLLLCAAAVKFFDLYRDLVPELDLLSSPRWRTAEAETEALLGLWLLTGAFPRLLWCAAFLFFCALAAVSSFLGVSGHESCGCLGARVSVSPWFAMAVDLIAVLFLVVARPVSGARAGVPSWAAFRQLLGISAGCAVTLAAILAALTWLYGSPFEALSWMRGDFITVEPPVLELGEWPVGEERTVMVQLTNHTARPVNLIGGMTTCRCVTSGDLRVTIPPNGSHSIDAQVTFRAGLGQFRQALVLYTDCDKQTIVMAHFTGRVAAGNLRR